MTLLGEEFSRLIPHAGSMCLIAEVLDWNETSIRCRSASHRSAHHPLSEHGLLHAVCGVEYAAQAAALHGGLLSRQAGTAAAPGFLAGLREVRLRRTRLDDLEEDLIIVVACQWADRGGLVYEFTVDAGRQRIVDGRLAIILNPEPPR